MASALHLTFLAEELSPLLHQLDTLGRAGLTTWLALAPLPLEALPPTLQALGALHSLAAQLPQLPSALCHYTPSLSQLEQGPLPTFPPTWVPVVLGAPRQGQFVVFRTLFTQTHPEALWSVFRQDRTPHQPLPEADLAYWLHQHAPERSLYELNLLHLEAGLDSTQARLRQAQEDPEPTTLIFDTLTEAQLATIATLLWEERPALLVGSSSLLGALAPLLPGRTPVPVHLPPISQLFALTSIPMTTSSLPGYFCHTFRDEARAGRIAAGALAAGQSVVISATQPRQFEALGRAVCRLLESYPLPRLVICGSALCLALASALEISALEFLAPLEPGIPLCRVLGGPLDGRELVVYPQPPAGRNFLEQVKQGR